jgi:putative ABC transport system ATP-binding protein
MLRRGALSATHGGRPVLSLEHVAKAHRLGPLERPVLRDVNITVEPGDFVGIWGARRSGKSTLLRIAAGLEEPDAGVVRFDGADLTSMSRARRASLRLGSIGAVVGGGPQVSEFTILDYVAFPLFGRCTRTVARAHAARALQRVGIAEQRDALWAELSDSEQALASLANGLVREPRLLLVDDPVVGLDPEQQADVVRILRATAVEQRVAIVMTSSVLAAIAPADEAFTLSDGTLKPVADRSASARVIEFPNGGQTA